jgi:hypothetical protein
MDRLTRSGRDAIVGWRRRYVDDRIKRFAHFIRGVTTLVHNEAVYVGFVMLVV